MVFSSLVCVSGVCRHVAPAAGAQSPQLVAENAHFACECRARRCLVQTVEHLRRSIGRTVRDEALRKLQLQFRCGPGCLTDCEGESAGRAGVVPRCLPARREPLPVTRIEVAIETEQLERRQSLGIVSANVKFTRYAIHAIKRLLRNAACSGERTVSAE